MEMVPSNLRVPFNVRVVSELSEVPEKVLYLAAVHSINQMSKSVNVAGQVVVIV